MPTRSHTERLIIPFVEITGVEESVRYISKNGRSYMSTYDLIMVMCKKKKLPNEDDKTYRRKTYRNAWTIWDRLDEDKKQELTPWCHTFKFSGQGNGYKPVITLEGALKLIQWLPGNVAKSIRSRAADILIRHFENDTEKFIAWAEETAKLAEEEEEAREPETKYIYGAESEAFPGLIKIGYASSLDSRMQQANVFSAPAPFKIVAHAPSMDASRDERMAHAFFADQREEGEFFRVSVDAVENFFTNCILTMYNYEKSALSWS